MDGWRWEGGIAVANGPLRCMLWAAGSPKWKFPFQMQEPLPGRIAEILASWRISLMLDP
jgi:hypothetical protein